MSMLAVCLGCGGSSSETPPPLEPDPQRLLPPAQEPGREEAPPIAPAKGVGVEPGASEPGVEDGAEFGIGPTPPARPGTPGTTPVRSTWGGTRAAPATARPKRPA